MISYVCIHSIDPVDPSRGMLLPNVTKNERGVAIVTGNKFTLMFTQPSNINGELRYVYCNSMVTSVNFVFLT